MIVKSNKLAIALAFTTASFCAAAVTNSGTLSTEKSSYSTADLIAISYKDSGAANDWVGIYKTGSINSSCKKSKNYIT
jgi:hypothetical protein